MAQEISLLYTGYHRVGWLRLIRADYRETAWEVLGSSRQLPGRSDDTWPGDGRHIEAYRVKSVPGRLPTLQSPGRCRVVLAG